jgi:alkanesulfonate monooxygenase SsuD/methylene tetrahydromethanopterin reductase-like flavin-dependent oxidoreductase (luciferase family)
MRLGVTVPQFRHDAEAAIDTARRAEAAGIDGVFVFDHLWPLGQRMRPALHSLTLLGALAAETETITLAPLVARVGLVPDAVLVHSLVSLHRMLGHRFIAALGTGDSLNREENEAYGVAFRPVAERLASLVDCCRGLRVAGVTTWVGGRSTAVREAAAEADGWNSWGTDAATFSAEAATVAPGRALTWGGQVLVGRTRAEADAKLRAHGTRPGLVTGTVDDLADHLRALAGAGASWAVCAPLDIGTDPAAVDLLVEAARRCELAGPATPAAGNG